MQIDEAALAGAGMRIGSARARGLAVALGEATDTVLAAKGSRSGGYGAWAWYAADLVLGALPGRELAALVDDFGLATPTPVARGEGPRTDPDRRAASRLLRERLVEALRLAADRPAFRSSDAAAVPHGRGSRPGATAAAGTAARPSAGGSGEGARGARRGLRHGAVPWLAATLARLVG
jgi:hypothetical protein